MFNIKKKLNSIKSKCTINIKRNLFREILLFILQFYNRAIFLLYLITLQIYETISLKNIFNDLICT